MTIDNNGVTNLLKSGPTAEKREEAKNQAASAPMTNLGDIFQRALDQKTEKGRKP